jgi:hypothetical protein
MHGTHSTARSLSKKDFAIGTLIVGIMAATFSTGSSGISLIVTFIPGLVVAWLIFAWLFAKQIDLPSAASFFPLYFATLGIQFLHFAEEFSTGFAERFPRLYGGAPFPSDLFVTFNMFSYFVFTIACILALHKNIRFLIVPALFFIVYGAIGNAIAHTWWVIYTKGYFPGFFTAQIYWIAGPVVLYQLLPSKKGVALVVVSFAVVLIVLLTLFASPAGMAKVVSGG